MKPVQQVLKLVETQLQSVIIEVASRSNRFAQQQQQEQAFTREENQGKIRVISRIRSRHISAAFSELSFDRIFDEGTTQVEYFHLTMGMGVCVFYPHIYRYLSLGSRLSGSQAACRIRYSWASGMYTCVWNGKCISCCKAFVKVCAWSD